MMHSPRNSYQLGWLQAMLVTFAIAIPANFAWGQEAEDGMVELNFPQEVEVKTLVDYVSQRLKVRILYDEKIANNKLSIRAPTAIPASSLMELLESALRMKGLALIDADVDGWKRIVEAKELPSFARLFASRDEINKLGAATAVTQAFPIRHVDPQQVGTLIKPFLSTQGANAVGLKEQKLLIVTDFAPNVVKIGRLIEGIDQAEADIVLEQFQIQHLEAATLAQQLTTILSSQTKAGGNRQAVADISSDPRTNQIFIAGERAAVDDVIRLARSLDVALGLQTEIYSPRYVSVERVDQLVGELLDPLTAKRLYRAAAMTDENMLVATTTPEIHQRIDALLQRLDVEPSRQQSPVKIYKIKNISAVEVLETLQAITGQVGGDFADPRYDVQNDFRDLRTLRGVFVPGRNRLPAFPGGEAPVPPALRQDDPTGVLPGAALPQLGNPVAAVGGMAQSLAQATRVSVDENTNSIVVVADPSVQRLYDDLIKSIDQRRPQVMIEAKIVILDTSDDFSLGVEFSTGDRDGLARAIVFSQFGLSTVDPVSGALSIVPGRGFNFTLVDPDAADAILRAMTRHRRTRVTSAPRILVNDNATGTLASVAEVPFTSVNASNTVATTSFAGFAEAGTTLEVTPRIAEGNHLQLDYRFSLNSFTGPAGDGVPPPRQTDEIISNVTIPDGHTIIVGGLKRENLAQTIENFPYLEQIPVLRLLTQSKVEANSQSTLFVFLRPIILRDDKFQDLKYLSERSLQGAGEPDDFPESRPLFVRPSGPQAQGHVGYR